MCGSGWTGPGWNWRPVFRPNCTGSTGSARSGCSGSWRATISGPGIRRWPSASPPASRDPPMIRVASFPYAAGTNPYLALYYRALEPHGIRVTLDARLEDRFVMARQGEFDVLHLHWTHEALWRRPGGLLSRFRGLAGAVRFLRLLRRLGKPLVWTVHDLEPL